MRRTLLSILLLSIVYFPACGDKDDSPSEDDKIDMTINCKSSYEDGGYKTFYKPNQGWVGDPIPFSDNGIFYIFYLQDWRTNFPYLHPWHLATSSDLSSFSLQGEVIPCGKVEDQDVALGTGGVVKNRKTGEYYAFYTGHQWTPAPGKPVQAVLLSTSPDMKTWTKKKDFFLTITGDGYNFDEFRDPHVYYDEESSQYKMIVSANRYGKAALALLTSTDLINWTQQDPFYTDPTVYMLECADVYKEGDYWYLVYSDIVDRKTHYRYSTSQNGPWKKATNSALDGIGFYAGKTANNGMGRYVFGWCPTRMGSTGREDEWGGSLVYHLLEQQPDGTLKVVMPPVFNSKFSKTVKIQDIAHTGGAAINQGIYTLSGAADVTFPRITNPSRISASITANQQTDTFGFVFGACENSEESYIIRFNQETKTIGMYKKTTAEEVKVSEVPLIVNVDMQYDIQVVVEKSVCSIYVNDETAFTNRMDKISQNPWKIFSEKGNAITFSNIHVYHEN